MKAFFTSNGENVDMVLESTFLATKLSELYFVVAFKGFEFVINMAGGSVEGFEKWLTDNNNISPLYAKGKSFGSKLTPEFLKKK